MDSERRRTDVVFVHGLGGDRVGWEPRSKGDVFLGPEKLLAKEGNRHDMKNVRIVTVGLVCARSSNNPVKTTADVRLAKCQSVGRYDSRVSELGHFSGQNSI